MHLTSVETQIPKDHVTSLSVAARGFLPPGANVCVAAPSSQIGNGN